MTGINTRTSTNEHTLKTIVALRFGPLQFGEIERAVKSKHAPALSAHLDKMVRDGLIERHIVSLAPRPTSNIGSPH